MLARLSFLHAKRKVLGYDPLWKSMREQITIAKILKIALGIFGAGGIASIFLLGSSGVEVGAGLLISGVGMLFCSFLLFKAVVWQNSDANQLLGKPAFERENRKEERLKESQSLSCEVALAEPMPLKQLAALLASKTKRELADISYASVLSRFYDVLCPQSTAISFEGRYLHANRVGGGEISTRSFIASQAPLHENYETFWRYVLHHQPILFDLTKRGEVYANDVPYYPTDLYKTMHFGEISVALQEIEGLVSTYRVTDGKKTASIRRCHYAHWQDHGAVSLNALKGLIAEVERISSGPAELIWAHCRAGVGRTGCLIAALILKEKIDCGEITLHTLDEDLVGLIVSLRKQRGPLFVQTSEQLDLLRQYAYSLLESM